MLLLYHLFAGRALALGLARQGREWRAAAAKRLPTATGDIREIVGQPVFVPLYNLYLRYGKIFKLRYAGQQQQQQSSWRSSNEPVDASAVVHSSRVCSTSRVLCLCLDHIQAAGCTALASATVPDMQLSMHN